MVPDHLKEIAEKQFKVLDAGFIRLVDVMGDDAAVCQAARVSYGAGTKSVSQDAALIDYLMSHRHTSPFEMCEIKLHIKAPMDVMRQWLRHRTANVNEYSTRYSRAINDMLETSSSSWRTQSGTNKQGSGDEFLPVDVGRYLSAEENDLHDHAASVYSKRLEHGVAREQARKDLPLCNYTELYWKIDAHNLMHFLSLRMDSHAQKEIREYATVIGEQIFSVWMPETWKSFKRHRLNSITLSEDEIAVLKATCAASYAYDPPDLPLDWMIEAGFLKKDGDIVAYTRKGNEMRAKITELTTFDYDYTTLGD